jgi:hypothetical protein
MTENLQPIQPITSRSDIEQLLTTPSKTDRINEVSGAILLKILEFMQDMQINLENLHTAVNKKTDIAQVCEIKDVLSELDLSSLISRLVEVESKIRAYVGDRISIVTLETNVHDLRNGVSTLLSSHCYKFQGIHTTAGGSATVEILHPGIEGAMNALAQMKTLGETPVSILSCKCEEGKLVIELSGDPSDDHILTYVIF